MADYTSIDLKFVNEIRDSVNLSYVTRAKIYPEDPNSLFLTMRGDSKTNAGGGISVYDISNSREPVFVSHLNVADSVPGEVVNRNQLEGQDRFADILVVIALESGVVHVLDVSDPSRMTEIGSLKLEGVNEGLGHFPALHTKIYDLQFDMQGSRCLQKQASPAADQLPLQIQPQIAKVNQRPRGIPEQPAFDDCHVSDFEAEQRLLVFRKPADRKFFHL